MAIAAAIASWWLPIEPRVNSDDELVEQRQVPRADAKCLEQQGEAEIDDGEPHDGEAEQREGGVEGHDPIAARIRGSTQRH